ncbi:phosphodiester glycosidase family protein [Paenibacillus sp. P96]|uniref:Phosphodiester glycosidase family protein n=1 Tax=Paenibacillus zeirhizosphaerae TaxID=2987519 RepID=A0ABT9FLD4_9BACL|nr:phosphodiester glycosidase family protein [Paenibacillus sp. P96]MDP4095533.1 phosphodiester glycosidase family protein [Paenibacillus sp. P96]
MKVIEVKQMNRFFMMALAPFIGLLLCLLLFNRPVPVTSPAADYASNGSLTAESKSVLQKLNEAEMLAESTLSTIHKTAELYKQTTHVMSGIVKTAAAQSARPGTLYNHRITVRLGTPYQTIDSDRITIELYKVNPGAYRGYAMKVKLKDPSAMQMSLGSGQPGSSETTLRAVQRTGAVAGINAGGFADSGGKRYPLSTTVLGGKYTNGFQPSYKDLTFVGLNENGKLIGGKFFSKSMLDNLKPIFGATFVPILLQNGQKVTIPSKWRDSPKRAPRTVIGNYKDDQLLVIVVDGYNESGSSGATLQELQNKMYALGIQDAYNLDGGGSSSLIVNSRVVNKPSDGSLRPVPTHFLFYK